MKISPIGVRFLVDFNSIFVVVEPLPSFCVVEYVCQSGSSDIVTSSVTMSPGLGSAGLSRKLSFACPVWPPNDFGITTWLKVDSGTAATSMPAVALFTSRASNFWEKMRQPFELQYRRSSKPFTCTSSGRSAVILYCRSQVTPCSNFSTGFSGRFVFDDFGRMVGLELAQGRQTGGVGNLDSRRPESARIGGIGVRVPRHRHGHRERDDVAGFGGRRDKRHANGRQLLLGRVPIPGQSPVTEVPLGGPRILSSRILPAGGGPADCATRQTRATATIKTAGANETDLRMMDALGR